jgi:hypothetical protein
MIVIGKYKIDWMKKVLMSYLLLFLFILMSANTAAKNNVINATIVQFLEQEQGTAPHSVRMTITDQFLRIDEDGITGDEGFILYDRQQKIIYSVSSEEQQIIKIRGLPVMVTSPIKLELQLKQQMIEDDAPLIAGQQANHYQLMVNNEPCYHLVSVPNLMPDVVLALSQFNQVLAGQQAATLAYIPMDLHDACDLTIHTFYPQETFKTGFPILFQWIDNKGINHNNQDALAATTIKYSRSLIHFKQQQVSSELFVLPKYPIVLIN